MTPLHTAKEEQPSTCQFSAYFWFGFVVWVPGGCMNLEDIPSSLPVSHPVTGLQQIVGLDGACCAPWVGL